ncbi:hypothetical protein ACFVYJ_13040 [Pontibacter sp. JAM-7]|uniref:hypothetical protein n=1 Tax=Pontibacter sp. JAM-7 TaxID=3366581 RepID=UPI003AF48D79
MTIGPDESKEDVLYAFSVEPRRDAAILEKYLQSYPQYRDELIDLSIEMLTAPVHEEIPADGKVSEGAAMAWDKFQSMLSGTESESRSTGVENPLANLDKKSFRDLAKSLGLSRIFLTRLRDQTITFSSIPIRFIEAVADAANVSADIMKSALNRPATISSAQSFKADGKPTAPEPISFDEAIETSNLSEEQKAALRAFKD